VETIRTDDVYSSRVTVRDARTQQPQQSWNVDSGTISSLAFSPDSRLLAGAETLRTGRNEPRKGEVLVWNARTGALAATLVRPGGSGPAVRVAFAADGRTVMSLHQGLDAADGYVREAQFWNLATEQLMRTMPLMATAVRVAFSPDGMLVAVVKGDYDLAEQINHDIVELWDTSTGVVKQTLPTVEQGSEAIAFSADGTLLAVGGTRFARPGLRHDLDTVRSGIVRLWDIRNGRWGKVITSPNLGERAVAFAPDGKTLATLGVDGTLGFWDVASGEKLRRYGPAALGIYNLAYAPDGQALFAAGQPGVLRWPLIGPAPGDIAFTSTRAGLLGDDLTVPKYVTLQGSWLNSMALSPDGETLVGGSARRHPEMKEGDKPRAIGWIDFVDVATGAQKRVSLGQEGPITSLAYAPAGNFLASAAEDDTDVWLTDSVSGKRVQTLRHAQPTQFAAFTPNGRNLVSAARVTAGGKGSITVVTVWDVNQGVKLREWSVPGTRLGTMVVSPDNRHLALGVGLDRGGSEVELWDLESARLLRQWPGATSNPLAVAFSSDGRLIASSERLPGHQPNAPQVTVRVVESGEITANYEISDTAPEVGIMDVVYLTYAPDGSLLAGRLADGRVLLWETATGRQWQPLAGSTREAKNLAFSDGGKTLVVEGGDGTVRFWSLDEVRAKGYRG
jgi:WD40 repeat protein